jgi:hypothetical protein
MTAAQRRRLRSWNKGRKIEDEGWTIVEYLPLPDKRVEYGVWHVPACWRGCEGWILVSGSWIPVQFTRDFGIERLRKREFNTLFSYLPPLPEEAFDDYKAKTPAAEPK